MYNRDKYNNHYFKGAISMNEIFATWDYFIIMLYDWYVY